MAVGRLFHYAVDAVLLSTVIAGVRRSSGFTYVTPSRHEPLSKSQKFGITCSPDTKHIGDGTLRSLADSYLGIGETVFSIVQGQAVNSQYFKRDTRP